MKKNLSKPEAESTKISEEEWKEVNGGKGCFKQEACTWEGIVD